MAANLHPLEKVVLERLNNWLPKLSNPVRIGEHDQTAFALGLMLDYAHDNSDQKFAELVASKAKQFYLSDKNCPLVYEPSGEDFLSPCLGEADVMRRVLPSQEFARWLRTFMPQHKRYFARTQLSQKMTFTPNCTCRGSNAALNPKG
jgi:hypothetical protein